MFCFSISACPESGRVWSLNPSCGVPDPSRTGERFSVLGLLLSKTPEGYFELLPTYRG